MSRYKKIVKPFTEFVLGSVLGMAQMKILRNKLTVFCYHDITNTPSDFSRENSLNVPPEVFNFQIEHIKRNFNVIGPKQLLEPSIPSNAALVTFDDGFKSFFLNAVPIIEKQKVPAIIFLNMGPILGETFWSGLIVYLCKRRPDFIEFIKSQLLPFEIGEQPYLSCSKALVEKYLKQSGEEFHEIVSSYVGEFAEEADLQKASRNPYIFFGNHTYTHYVSSQMSDDDFLKDVKKNSKLLVSFPNYIDYFAFPFGAPKSTFTKDQVKLLFKEDFKKVFYSAASSLNSFPLTSYLDRITLLSDDNSTSKIKYRVMKAWLLS